MSSVSSPAIPAAPSTRNLLSPLMYALVGLVIIGAMLYTIFSTGQAPDVLLNIFTTRFLGIFIEAVPFLLLGSLISGLIESFVRTDDIVRYMPTNPILSTLAGVFMGLIFPVCECGVVPVVRRLYMKGLPISVGMTFLLAAPFMNPIVFASTYIAFGFGPIFIGRFLITFAVSAAVGLIFALTAKPKDVLQSGVILQETGWESLQPRRSLGSGMRYAMITAATEFFEMGRYLVLGCLLASAMQTIVPQEAILSIAHGPVLSALVMLVLAFVLSVCSTVDAFIALAFSLTFPTGSLLGFLSFGPMVDIKSTLMFRGIFKPRIVFYLVLLPFLMNWTIATLINISLGYY